MEILPANMPTLTSSPTTAKVIPFSISTLTAYEQCPKRFYLTKIAKRVQEAQYEHRQDGVDKHRALELAVNGTQGLPEKYRAYQPIVSKVLAVQGVKETERKFGLTSSFRPTSFFAKDCWVRGVIDLTITKLKSALVLDWKAGKRKNDSDQLKLTAAVIFAEKPFVETVRTGYVWLAHDKIDTETYKRSDVAGIWQEFLPRVARMERSLQNTDFPPRPSGLCRDWCPVGKSECEFCGH